MTWHRKAIGALVALSLSACATPGFKPELRLAEPELNPVTVTEHTLKWLPGPGSQIPVAVYGLADETGAFQQSATGQTLSRAVTQAPTPILIKALQDAGNRRWFSVIERENLQNLLKERQIIVDMRRRYLGEEELNREALPALRFAGILIEGAISGYDTNTVTGGAGARYLGIGATTQYREDAVSIYLRAVSVKTGEVLLSITSEQRVASIAVQGNAFRFVAFQELLEAEAGLTMNQPRHLAVRQAIEKAVYGMIVEGAELGLWAFEDEQAGQAAISHYR
ncbi:MAG: CsgG/HfaB family protein, partial [Pseudomonadota bacterium]